MDFAIRKIGIKEAIEKYFSKKYIYAGNYTPNFRREKIEKYFKEKRLVKAWQLKNDITVDIDKLLVPLFVEWKTPIFTAGYSNEYRYQTLRINDCLSTLNFMRIKDVYTAYQEIAQYMSGVLGLNDKEMIQISDVDMRDKKGFDEWSFKKKKEKE